MAGMYVDSDELFDLKREMDSGLEKLEMRIEQQLHALQTRKGEVTRKELNTVWDEIHAMSTMLGQQQKVISRLVAAVEELSLG